MPYCPLPDYPPNVYGTPYSGLDTPLPDLPGPNTATPGTTTVSPTMWTIPHSKYPYDGFTTKTTYTWNTNKEQLPVAKKGDGDTDPPTPGKDGLQARTSAAYIQTAAPSGTKTVEFYAKRTGGKPKAPNPNALLYAASQGGGAGAENEILQDSIVEVESFQLDPNGTTHVWVMRGMYTYILLQPIWALDGINIGADPTDATLGTANDAYMTADQFDYTLNVQPPKGIGGVVPG